MMPAILLHYPELIYLAEIAAVLLFVVVNYA